MDMKEEYWSSWFPSPTGVNYYELKEDVEVKESLDWFPSPTGVNYYE